VDASYQEFTVVGVIVEIKRHIHLVTPTNLAQVRPIVARSSFFEVNVRVG
jgi:hypothetical protein